MKKFLIPLGVFAALVVVLAIGLTRDPKTVPSPLIDKPAPMFDATLLYQPDQHFSPKDMLGQVWLLNVFASWCVTCRFEHPLLMDMAKEKSVVMVGLNYKDNPVDAKKLLRRDGNPFDLVVTDPQGRIGIDYGVYGVPETYLIDAQGHIRYKQIGAITPEALRDTILPMIRKLKS